MKSHYLRFTFFAMGGPNEVQLYARDEVHAKTIASKVLAEVRRIESKFSRYQENSILSKINLAAGGPAVTIDTETADLLRYAHACFKQSGGLFDITSGVLRKVWNFKKSELPSTHLIREVVERIGWERVQWGSSHVSLPEGMEIDFGGIGKEYAVDRAINVLAENGIESGLVNLSGDLRAIGPRPDGAPWRVGLTHPRQDGAISGVVELYRGAVATSGDYERYITVDGKRFCHIMNPRSGWPVAGVQAVTVVADSCLVAGSATTTAMLRGASASSYLRDLGLSYFFIDDQGRTHVAEHRRQGSSRFRRLELQNKSHVQRLIPASHTSELGSYEGGL